MIETWYKQDINKPVKVQYLKGNVFSLDNNGNLIGIECYNGDQPASLAGSVSASVIRADGSTVAVSGTLSENKVSVALPQAACAIPGVISIVIKVTNGSEVSTVGAVVATVYQSSTDSIVDPGTIIPSIDALISEIETAVVSIPADYSSLWASLAPAFSTSTDYVTGNYVTYNGSLWRFKADHPAGTWDAAHCTQVSIGTELSLPFLGSFPNTGDLDDIAASSIYTVTQADSRPTHYPSAFGNKAGFIITQRLTKSNKNYLFQQAINYETGVTFSRYKYQGVWRDWVPLVPNLIELKGLINASVNVNDIMSPTIYSAPAGNTPLYWGMGQRPGTLITTNLYGSESYSEQMILPFFVDSNTLTERNEFGMYLRRYQSSQWHDWAFFKLTRRNHMYFTLDENDQPVRHTIKYYAFGDSTTWGYSADRDHAQSPWNYPAIVGDLTGLEVHNNADPAQGLLKDWSEGTPGNFAIIPTIQQMISDGDFEDTALITVGWAYNDSSYYSTVDFGDPSDPVPESTTGITTWLGYYSKILDILQKAAPKAVVILVTGYGSPDAVNGRATCRRQFTRTISFRDVTKTHKEAYDALEEMAHLHGYCCVNQAKGCVINAANANVLIGDNIHPTYETYRVYGNNLASRIAAYFQNV